MTPVEHSRDAGVIFESTENLRRANGATVREGESLLWELEHNRDRGVIFEAVESPAKANGPAVRKAENPSSRSEYSRDPRMVSENTESPRKVNLPAAHVYASQSEHSRDPGIVFDNTDSRRPGKAWDHRDDGSVLGVVFSMFRLGGAAAAFTFHQMQNAASLPADPGRALHRMQDAIDSLASAMTSRWMTSRR